MRSFICSSYIMVSLALCAASGHADFIADFEDVSLGSAGYYNGSDLAGGFHSQDAFFNNDYSTAFQSFLGWAASDHTDNTTPGFGNQYSAFPGSGADGSSQYGVLYAFSGDEVYIEIPDGNLFQSIDLTNTTYTALTLLNGDEFGFAKQFGGVTGNDPDYFGWTLTGVDSNGATTGSFDVYLADYRFGNNALDYVLDDWMTVDLTQLGNAVRIYFDPFSSDTGDFGINTPTYLAADNVVYAAVPELGSFTLLGGAVVVSGMFIGWRRHRNVVKSLCIAAAVGSLAAVADAGPYAPAAGQPGSTAVSKDDSAIDAWATSVVELVRGPVDASDPGQGVASFGTGAEALGPATGSPTAVVSLGDGGAITLSFDNPIFDGTGFDFAVFENSFGDTFLELAFVEVSSNGTDFFRFDAVSLTSTTNQVGGFDPIDPTNIHNLAGKYRGGFGTPFDLSELAGVSPLLDVQSVSYVRIVDVVGSINPTLGSLDSLGNLVNDPWPTAFGSGGFDLDGIAVMHAVPEANTFTIVAITLFGGTMVRARCRRK